MNSALEQGDVIPNILAAGKENPTIISIQGKSGHRTYSFKLANVDKQQNRTYFISLLTGPDNGLSYTYLGMLSTKMPNKMSIRAGWAQFGDIHFYLTEKSAHKWDDVPVLGLRRMFRNTCGAGTEEEYKMMPVYLAVNCSGCGRLVTKPESIIRGMGPTCARVAGRV